MTRDEIISLIEKYHCPSCDEYECSCYVAHLTPEEIADEILKEKK